MELKHVDELSRNELILYVASVVDFNDYLLMFQAAENQLPVFELTSDEQYKQAAGYAMIVTVGEKSYAAWNPCNVEEADNIFEHCALFGLAPTVQTFTHIYEGQDGRAIYGIELIDDQETYAADHPDRGRAMMQALVKSKYGNVVPALTFPDAEPGTVYPAVNVFMETSHVTN